MSVQILSEPAFPPVELEIEANNGSFALAVHNDISDKTIAVVIFSRVRYQAVVTAASVVQDAHANFELRPPNEVHVWYLKPGIGLFLRADQNSAGDTTHAIYLNADPTELDNGTTKTIISGLPAASM